MAYIIARNSGMWEIRESHSTPAGPRSRTLATFKTLTPEAIERARERSRKDLHATELRKAARRAGAPVAAQPSDRSAGELLTQLAEGHRPRPLLTRLLANALSADASRALAPDGRTTPPTDEEQLTDSERAAGAWVAATPERRGEALRNLLLLTDWLPRATTREQLQFPRISSQAA
jgi:hypothetical protein